MGCYDTIEMIMECPVCKRDHVISAQTKDIGRLMFVYKPLPDGWFTLGSSYSAHFKESPIPLQFPGDSLHMAYKDVESFYEAQASVPIEFHHLDQIDVVAECPSLKYANSIDDCTFFTGKMKLKNGKLIGNIYNIIIKGR
jgi:hypothetical protein